MQVTKTSGRPGRILFLDAFRGLILILMALRHAELFLTTIARPNELWNAPQPTDFGLLYWVSFIAQIDATGFFFIMGVGMVLMSNSYIQKRWTLRNIWLHFITRGCILIILQFFLENPLWYFDNPGRLHPAHVPIFIYFGVLFALGVSFIVNSFLTESHKLIVLCFAITCLVLPQVYIPAVAQSEGLYPLWLRALFIPGQTGHVLVLFTIIPWIGFTSLGLLFGKSFVNSKRKTLHTGLLLGSGAIILFFFLRVIGYGDFRPFSFGHDDWRLFFFFRKYPPSLVYIIATLGETLVLLWGLSKMEKILPEIAKPLIVYGQCPLFFYIIHLVLLGVIAQVLVRNGTNLVWMYLLCVGMLAGMYPLCRAYGKFKQRQKSTSVWRFF